MYHAVRQRQKTGHQVQLIATGWDAPVPNAIYIKYIFQIRSRMKDTVIELVRRYGAPEKTEYDNTDQTAEQ